MNEVELYYDPTELSKYFLNGMEAEMLLTDQAFICGLIKEFQPKKLIEIGVAAGGTTAIILNCISILKLDTEMFSLDKSTEYYQDKGKKTGYLLDQCNELRKNHTLLTGKFSVEYLERIGGQIDFLILDTAHSLPGELLDFLAFFPFLKEGCVVVLHDIILNHLDNRKEFATKLLFDTVVAKKYINIGESGNFPNIGAFQVTKETGKYIENVFSALTITWAGKQSDVMLSLYRELYRKHYPSEIIQIFDMAVELNQNTLSRLCDRGKLKRVVGAKSVYVYGCGDFGKRYCREILECDIPFKGYIVSDNQKKAENSDEIYYLSEIEFDQANDVIFVGVSNSMQSEICLELAKKGIREFIMPAQVS